MCNNFASFYSLQHEQAVPLTSLDYDKIKKDLINSQDRTKGLLLQALRWVRSVTNKNTWCGVTWRVLVFVAKCTNLCKGVGSQRATRHRDITSSEWCLSSSEQPTCTFALGRNSQNRLPRRGMLSWRVTSTTISWASRFRAHRG